MYELRFDEQAQNTYQQADINLARRLNRGFERLRDNPINHPNPLKGTLAGLYRYRVGDWRVIYNVNEEESFVGILQIVRRSRAYE
jgi:mRNA interferase RelE/StbE